MLELGIVSLIGGSMLIMYGTYRILLFVLRTQLECRACGAYPKLYGTTLCSPCDKAERLSEFRHEQIADDELRRVSRDYWHNG